MGGIAWYIYVTNVFFKGVIAKRAILVKLLGLFTRNTCAYIEFAKWQILSIFTQPSFVSCLVAGMTLVRSYTPTATIFF